MDQLLLFHFPACPYCQETYRWLTEVRAEHPELQDIPLTMIDEKKQPVLADTFDYWYVPTFFYGKDKLHEGACSKQIVLDVLQKAKARMK